VRLWGQDELSCRPPAAPATSSQQRTDGWAAMPEGGCLHPWRPTERQGIIGLRPAIWKILIVTWPSHRARCLHAALPLCLKVLDNYKSPRLRIDSISYANAPFPPSPAQPSFLHHDRCASSRGGQPLGPTVPVWASLISNQSRPLQKKSNASTFSEDGTAASSVNSFPGGVGTVMT